MKKRTIIIVIIVLIAVIAAVAIFITNKKDVQVATATVSENTVEITVMATGYVQPVESVEVGTQVSGVIEKIYVDFNSTVTQGQLLAQLDTLTLTEKLAQAKAALKSSESEKTYAKQNYDRTKQLFEAEATTKVAMEEATNKLEQAETSVDNAKANVHQAEVNLSYAYIHSPINGVVLDRSVGVGQTVAASFNTPTLFTIAEDLTEMQVEADVDEADIGQIRVGQKVNFTVDAYNMDTFEGVVTQIRLQPIVTNNVVTYTVIIDAPNPEEKLFPGMTANISIIARHDTGLTVPVSALTFRMTDEVASHLSIPRNEIMSQSEVGRDVREVWVKEDGHFYRREVEIGINDGVYVRIESGLADGEEVVISATLDKKATNNEAASNPLMPRRGGGGSSR